MQLRPNEFQKFIPGFELLKGAGEGGGGGDGILFLDTPHHHTHMPGFDHHRYAEGVEGGVDTAKDLVGQSFLHLKAPGEDIDHPGEFTEADNVAVGNIGDMDLAKKRQHMVFTKGIQFNIFNEDHFAVFFPEHGGTQDSRSILLVPLGKELHGFCGAFGGFQQTLPGCIFADFFDDGGKSGD